MTHYSTASRLGNHKPEGDALEAHACRVLEPHCRRAVEVYADNPTSFVIVSDRADLIASVDADRCLWTAYDPSGLKLLTGPPEDVAEHLSNLNII